MKLNSFITTMKEFIGEEIRESYYTSDYNIFVIRNSSTHRVGALFDIKDIDVLASFRGTIMDLFFMNITSPSELKYVCDEILRDLTLEEKTMITDFISPTPHVSAQWEKGDSSSDVYHSLLQLLQENKLTIKNETELEHILNRMYGNDSTTDIVADFIYSDRYKLLREELDHYSGAK